MIDPLPEAGLPVLQVGRYTLQTGVAILAPEWLGSVYIGRAGIADLNYIFWPVLGLSVAAPCGTADGLVRLGRVLPSCVDGPAPQGFRT
jgi:hypothetical protein